MPEGCSIVIATIGRRRQKLNACLASLFQQTYKDLEVILVAPRAALLEGIDDRVRIIETNDINGSRNKNVGIENASKDFVAFTDDDCIAEENCISNMMRGFEGHDVAAVCGAVYLLSDPTPDVKGPQEKKVFKKTRDFLPPWEIGTGGCICVKKEVIQRIGLFDGKLGPGSRFYSAEDMDIIHRIIDADYSVLRDPSAVIFHDKTETYEQEIIRFYRYRFGLGAFFCKIRRNERAREFFFDNFLVDEIRKSWRDLRRSRTKEIARDCASFAGALLGFFACAFSSSS